MVDASLCYQAADASPRDRTCGTRPPSCTPPLARSSGEICFSLRTRQRKLLHNSVFTSDIKAIEKHFLLANYGRRVPGFMSSMMDASLGQAESGSLVASTCHAISGPLSRAGAEMLLVHSLTGVPRP